MTRKAIRDLDTGFFACDHGQWTTDGNRAQNFPDYESAMVEVDKRKLKNAELVTLDDNGRVTSGSRLRISK